MYLRVEKNISGIQKSLILCIQSKAQHGRITPKEIHNEMEKALTHENMYLIVISNHDHETKSSHFKEIKH